MACLDADRQNHGQDHEHMEDDGNDWQAEIDTLVEADNIQRTAAATGEGPSEPTNADESDGAIDQWAATRSAQPSAAAGGDTEGG
jgi:hypothetical protein